MNNIYCRIVKRYFETTHLCKSYIVGKTSNNVLKNIDLDITREILQL
jgi:hypothetical protein